MTAHTSWQSQAELTAGVYNTSIRNGYIPIMSMLADLGILLHLARGELCNQELTSHAGCNPEMLVAQIRACASGFEIPITIENLISKNSLLSCEQIQLMLCDEGCYESIRLPQVEHVWKLIHIAVYVFDHKLGSFFLQYMVEESTTHSENLFVCKAKVIYRVEIWPDCAETLYRYHRSYCGQCTMGHCTQDFVIKYAAAFLDWAKVALQIFIMWTARCFQGDSHMNQVITLTVSLVVVESLFTCKQRIIVLWNVGLDFILF